MAPQYLLDTHVLVRWLLDSRKLSRAQLRVLRGAVEKGEPLAISDITLLEIAVLVSGQHSRIQGSIHELLSAIVTSGFRIIPIDADIAAEITAIGSGLGDPADRTIVATARVHRLRLLTSDQRIVESKLVPVVE